VFIGDRRLFIGAFAVLVFVLMILFLRRRFVPKYLLAGYKS